MDDKTILLLPEPPNPHEGMSPNHDKGTRLNDLHKDLIHIYRETGRSPKSIRNELNISEGTYYRVLQEHTPTEWAEFKIKQITAEQKTTIDEMTSHYVDGRGADIIDNIMEAFADPGLIRSLIEQGKVNDIVKIYNALMSGSFKKLEIGLKHVENKQENKTADNFLDIMAKATEKLIGDDK